MIILVILIVFSLDYVMELFKENWCWSILGLENFMKSKTEKLEGPLRVQPGYRLII